MKVFHIVEFDRDYRTVTEFFTKEFATRAEAEEWCEQKSWRGYDYFLDPRFPDQGREAAE